ATFINCRQWSRRKNTAAFRFINWRGREKWSNASRDWCTSIVTRLTGSRCRKSISAFCAAKVFTSALMCTTSARCSVAAHISNRCAAPSQAALPSIRRSQSTRSKMRPAKKSFAGYFLFRKSPACAERKIDIMEILRSIPELARLHGPLFLAIGVFDGVHRGHQAVISTSANDAESANGTPVVVTFDPHPMKVLRPREAPHLLTATQHKIRLIRDLGVEHLLIIKFDKAFAA